MNEAKKKIMRKRYFIKKGFQTKFFIGFVLLLALQAALVAGLFMRISSQTLTTGYSGSKFVIDKTSSFFFTNFVIMSVIVGIAIGLAGVLVFIFLSHRIAGPLFRFEKSLEEMSRGNLDLRINLRKTDQLTELQTALNVLLERLNNQLKEVKKSVEEAGRLASKHDKEENMREVREAIVRIKEKMDFFKSS